MPTTLTKKQWLLSAESFKRLLGWLDDGNDSDGRKYLELRGRLVEYFERKNCLAPDELADETLNRVARRLEEEGKIESETPLKFCYITARYVFLESLRTKEKNNVPVDDLAPEKLATSPTNDEPELKEKMLACLEKCVGELDEAARKLIVGFYHGAERIKIENRRKLAGDFGVSQNALNIRACRIRYKLEICVKNCAKNGE